jgi:hypothetical protein
MCDMCEHFVTQSHILTLGMEHTHFSFPRAVRFSACQSEGTSWHHSLWEEGQANYVDSYRLGCQETVKMQRVLGKVTELFRTSLVVLKGTKCGPRNYSRLTNVSVERNKS